MADTAELAGLPGRVEALAQNVGEFRVEVRNEFASVRAEMRSEFALVRSEIKSAIKESEDETGRQMFNMHEDLVQRIDASKDEVLRQVRMLHEDLVVRIGTIGEGRP